MHAYAWGGPPEQRRSRRMLRIAVQTLWNHEVPPAHPNFALIALPRRDGVGRERPNSLEGPEQAQAIAAVWVCVERKKARAFPSWLCALDQRLTLRRRRRRLLR
jgi:hypothetical protein